MGNASLMVRAALLLAGGGLLGLAINRVHPHGVRFAAFSPPTACAAPLAATGGPGAPAPAVEVLSLAQVASLCGNPRALVADARSAERFAEGHISGAIHLPCASSRMAASAALEQLTDKDTLVVYGDGTSDAVPVADELRRRVENAGLHAASQAGMRVAVLEGGFAAWSQAGLACSSGPCAGCGVH